MLKLPGGRSGPSVLGFQFSILLLIASAPALPGEVQKRDEDIEWEFAERLLGTDLYTPAAEQYRKFIKLYPQDDRGEEAYFKLGDCLLRARKYEESAAAIEELHTKYKEGKYKRKYYELSWFRLGHARFLQGKYEAACKALEEFLALPETAETKPYRSSATYELAVSYHSLNKFAEALKWYQASANLKDPKYLERAAYMVGETQFALGKDGDAVASLESFVKAYPTSSLVDKARLNLGHAYFRSKDYARAADWYRQVRGEEEAEGRFGEFQCMILSKSYPEAIRVGEEFLRRFPGHASARRVMFATMECCFVTKSWESCARYAVQLAEDKGYENREMCLYKLAASLYYLGPEKAKDCIQVAGSLLQDYPDTTLKDDAHFLLGESYLRLKNWKEAIAHYAAVSNQGQFYGEATYQLARAYDLAGMEAEAAAAFQRHFEIAGRDGVYAGAALFRSATLYDKLKNYAQAASLYLTYLNTFGRANPEQYEDALYRRVMCLFSLKQYEEMAKALRLYLREFPAGRHKGNALYWLGWYYQYVKDHSKAIEYLEGATQAPGDFQVEALLRLADSCYSKARQDAEKDPKAVRDLDLRAANTYFKLMKLKPEMIKDVKVYPYTATVFQTQKLYPEAIQVYDLLLKHHPDYQNADEAYYWMGRLLAMLPEPQWERSLECHQKVVKEYPESKLFYYALAGKAWALWKMGKSEAALPDFDKVVKARVPGAAELAKFAMGCIYYDQKQYDLALPLLLFIGLTYADDEYSPEALYKAGRILVLRKQYNECKEAWNFLLKHFSQSAWAKKARTEAKELPGFKLNADGLIEKGP